MNQQQVKDRNCREEGHHLEEVKAVVGYKCKSCGKYKRKDMILGTSFGRCPKCDAPENKLTSHFGGSEHIEYECKNCGHSWRQLM